MYLDNHLTIRGILTVRLLKETSVNKDTKFTIVMPQSDPSLQIVREL
jgi:hypothetical protein